MAKRPQPTKQAEMAAWKPPQLRRMFVREAGSASGYHGPVTWERKGGAARANYRLPFSGDPVPS